MLLGDERLTVAEQVRILVTATGRRIAVRPVERPAEAVPSRFPGGVPQAPAGAVVERVTLLRADTVGPRTGTVARPLGSRPAACATG
ncbi:hypothetical protein ACIQF6_25645 [Kitasatospora sp. NPDC092948]|uniref:hypothetical protein n=1 Tax=Kitasatospora sp. NPDC092948 TaxID=3364088 RepID=UPI003820DF22